MWETMVEAMLKSMGFTKEEFHDLVTGALTQLQEMGERLERIENKLNMQQSAEVIELPARKEGTNGGQG